MIVCRRIRNLKALIYKPLYKKPVCKFILSVIENSTKEHIDISNLTIEHILPQKENAAVWKKEVGDDYGRVYEIYLHTLGNVTITGHNSELGTKSFNGKKNIIRDNSKANILNKEVLSSGQWNETSILNRAKDYSIPYADRTYISNDERKFRRAKQIDNSGIFFETKLLSINIISNKRVNANGL